MSYNGYSRLLQLLHNLEEAIWFPKWSQQAGKWHSKVKAEFRFVVIALTALAYLFTYLGPQSIWAYLTSGYMLAMLLNVFFLMY